MHLGGHSARRRPFSTGRLGCASLVALAASCAHAPLAPAPPYPRAAHVTAVEVAVSDGGPLKPDDIRAHLATKPGSWFDPAVWQNDLRRVVRFCEAEGFYRATVVDHAVERRDGTVVLRVTVREGTPVRLVEFAVRGLDGLPTDVAEDARAGIGLAAGQTFREAAWDATKKALAARLQSHGYAEAALRSEARVDPDAGVARARIDVQPGERYRFGAVRLASPAPPGVSVESIVSEARAAVPPDDWYDPAAVTQAQRRVFEMGVFSAVSASAADPDAATARVPVVIAVRPGPEMTARTGVGLTLAPGRDEVRALAEVVLRRFLGGARTLRLRLEGGYSTVPDVLTELSSGAGVARRDGPTARLSLDLGQPRLFGDPRLSLFARAVGALELEAAYRSLGARGRVGVSVKPMSRLEVQLAYGFDATDVFDTPLLPDASAGATAFGCASPCTVSYAELTTRWDTHSVEHPRVGERATVRVRGAGGPLAGGYGLVEVRAEAGIDRFVGGEHGLGLGLRVSGGSVVSTGGRPVPVTQRLFGGGLEMRGFGPRRLSPFLLVPHAGGVDGVPTGGQGLLEGSLTVDHDLSGNLGLAAFLDVGAVSVEPFDPVRLVDRLLYATGVGLRYRTPLGALRVDLAFRLPIGGPLPEATLPGAAPGTLAPAGCFGIGGGERAGAPESPCAIHISLGESF